MAEDFILLDDAKVRTRTRTVDGELVHEEVNQIVDEGEPVRDSLSSSALAAGASVDLNGTAIASGKTGKLRRVILASTAGLVKWIIKLRDGATETNVGVAFTSQQEPTFAWESPQDSEDNLPYGDGNENFRVTATNLDQENGADVYATIYWAEVDN